MILPNLGSAENWRSDISGGTLPGLCHLSLVFLQNFPVKDVSSLPDFTRQSLYLKTKFVMQTQLQCTTTRQVADYTRNLTSKLPRTHLEVYLFANISSARDQVPSLKLPLFYLDSIRSKQIQLNYFKFFKTLFSFATGQYFEEL